MPLWFRVIKDAELGNPLYIIVEDLAIIPAMIRTTSYKFIKLRKLNPVGDYSHPLILNARDFNMRMMLRFLMKVVLRERYHFAFITLPDFIVHKYGLRHELERTKLVQSYVCPRLIMEKKDIEYIWRYKLSKKRRNAIRKAQKVELK
jgi:hypothetical protein